MDRENFRTEMNTLTQHHRKACKAYDDICNGLSRMAADAGTDGPFLPVSIFKSLELKSIPDDEVKRQLTSSGTTGQQVSRIFLDAETSVAQQKALCDIVGEYIGEKRIPMLIIDSPDVLRDRTKYSARGAGILGFSMMASKRFYALDNDMNLDLESIKEFAETAAGGPCFAFGFTYMIWQYFCQKDDIMTGKMSSIDLSNCYLIHGGGWKKLQSQAVSNDEFKSRLNELWGIKKVSDYYGMAEQTGSIFMECECGHLHVSKYSDICALNPADFTPCETGEWGLIALESTLPKSYPGHKLMTEDWGRILGEDDCPCGRPGKYFEIKGRISKAEIRGCSDTFAADRDARATAGAAAGRDIIAGLETSSRTAFDETAINFLEELSKLFTKEVKYRSVPEIYALGFWCRRAHMEKIKSRQLEIWNGAEKKGRGPVLHIAPSNMPTMFAYSWICSLLAGCSSIVRISTKENAITDMILEGIREILSKPEYEGLRKQNQFVRFDHSDETLKEISGITAGRIIWGGDETVNYISSIPMKEGCTDITFPDKYSIALLDADRINQLSDDELKVQTHLFYNDTYGADQNACSSPKIVFWTGEKAGRDRWVDALAKEAENYNLEPWMATEKYRILCVNYAEHEGIGPAEARGNKLIICPCEKPELFEAKMGMFYECHIDDFEQLVPFLGDKIQTIVTNIDGIYDKARAAGCSGVDRAVSIGEALDFDTIWDRKDIIDLLTE
ncbi:MAG: acyl-CoA reductase [Bacillota bacterium]|nr:acyl-CoA reductase [Bacillota bacterium]